MVMITCDKGRWEWKNPEGGSAPGKEPAGYQGWQPACAALEASLEIKGSIEDRKVRLP
jgi:hypothetical protein